MRKTKFYFGRNKGIDEYGRKIGGNPKKLRGRTLTDRCKWEMAVPRILQPYFWRRRQRALDMQALKIRMNAVVGNSPARPADGEDFGSLLVERRALATLQRTGRW